MFRWFKAKKEKDNTLLDLQSQLQSLRMDIQDRDKTIANLKDDLNRERESKTIQISESNQAFIEKLINEASTPVSQLLTQAYLLESENKPIQAKDVIYISKRLIHVLENAGMSIEGKVGDRVSYDPNYHSPLSISSEIKAGDQVVIKFVGISYRGKIIRKMGVEKCLDV